MQTSTVTLVETAPVLTTQKAPKKKTDNGQDTLASAGYILAEAFNHNYKRCIASLECDPKFWKTKSPLEYKIEGVIESAGVFLLVVSVRLTLPVEIYKDDLPENDGIPITLSPAQVALVEEETFRLGPVAMWKRFREIKAECCTKDPLSSDDDDGEFEAEGFDDMVEGDKKVKAEDKLAKENTRESDEEYFEGGRAALLKSGNKDLRQIAEEKVITIGTIVKFIETINTGLEDDPTTRQTLKELLYATFDAVNGVPQGLESRLMAETYKSLDNGVYAPQTDRKCSYPFCDKREQGSEVVEGQRGRLNFNKLPCICCHSVKKSDELPFYQEQEHLFCEEHTLGPDTRMETKLSDWKYRAGLSCSSTNVPFDDKAKHPDSARPLPPTFDAAIRAAFTDPLPGVLFEDGNGEKLVGVCFLPFPRELVADSKTAFSEEMVCENTFLVMCTTPENGMQCVVATYNAGVFSFSMHVPTESKETPGTRIAKLHKITQVPGGVQCLLCVESYTAIPNHFQEEDVPHVEGFIRECHGLYRYALFYHKEEMKKQSINPKWVKLGKLTPDLTKYTRTVERSEHPGNGKDGRPIFWCMDLRDLIEGSDGGSSVEGLGDGSDGESDDESEDYTSDESLKGREEDDSDDDAGVVDYNGSSSGSEGGVLTNDDGSSYNGSSDDEEDEEEEGD
ncbi:hypothetical protein T484DRAFT_1757439 [Baffinella frigidus]|nr:hypothetical protein T484DRAFT_1757439 [Cryptophyta sp. CCMP2293]